LRVRQVRILREFACIRHVSDTMLILRSLEATHRVWINAAARHCVELEASHAGVSEILTVVAGQKAKQMYESGDLDFGVISCGQGVVCHDMPTVEELFDRIFRQAEEGLKKLGGLSCP
jgi:NADH:quinone reductase (non-electrogenic)